jgi:hypothetical protein
VISVLKLSSHNKLLFPPISLHRTATQFCLTQLIYLTLISIFPPHSIQSSLILLTHMFLFSRHSIHWSFAHIFWLSFLALRLMRLNFCSGHLFPAWVFKLVLAKPKFKLHYPLNACLFREVHHKFININFWSQIFNNNKFENYIYLLYSSSLI